MKVSKAMFLDDGVSVPGVLIERFLCKPVFYPFDASCGWHSQIITKSKENKVILLFGESHIGKVSYYGKKKKEEGEKRK